MSPDNGEAHGFQEPDDQPAFDKLLKKLMANGTVMRRYIAVCFIISVTFLIIALIRGDQIDENTDRSHHAICAVIIYAEQQAERIDESPKATPGAAKGLRDLAKRMRVTNVKCPPPSPLDRGSLDLRSLVE